MNLRRLLPVSVVLAASVASCFAQCRNDACSDDRIGRLDNQRLTWQASEGATYYVIAIHTYGEDGFSVYEECASTNATFKDLVGTSCYSDRLCVKACKPDTAEPPGADLCSQYNVTEPTEVLPYICVRTTVCTEMRDGDARTARCDSCEEPCAPGEPTRAAWVPDCGT